MLTSMFLQRSCVPVDRHPDLFVKYRVSVGRIMDVLLSTVFHFTITLVGTIFSDLDGGVALELK